MRIQLAVPWTDEKNVAHRAGTKLNVTPDVAKQLIKDGFAGAAGVGIDDDEAAENDTPHAEGSEASGEARTLRQPEPGDTVKGAGYGRS